MPTAILRWSWRRYQVEDERQHRQLNAYAARARIDARQLWRRNTIMAPGHCKAGWFEYRWRQTGEQQFIRLADETGTSYV